MSIIVFACKKNLDNPFPESVLTINPSVNSENSKASVTNLNISSCQIGVQVTNSIGDALYEGKSLYNNLLLKYQSLWFFDNGSGGESRVILYANNARIFAYYPYSININGIGNSATINLNIPAQNTMSQMSDYLWASQSTTLPSGGNPINANNPSVTLNMNHALSQIAFVFFKEGYIGTALLEQITINDYSVTPNIRINNSGTNDLKMSVSDGLISGGETSSNISVTSINNIITLTADPGTELSVLNNYINGYIFIIPANIPDVSKIEAVIRIDGADYIIALPGTGVLNLLPGKKYIYKGRLMPRGILAVDNVFVTNWSEGGEIDVDSD